LGRNAGGFLDLPEQFFIHPRARKLFQQRMRYLIARYAYSPRLFAWEFWNEVALTDRFSSQVCTAWHKEMGDYVKALDPTGRLVTTSYHSRFDNEAFALRSQDIPQVHVYVGSYGGDLIAWTVDYVKEQKAFGKPVLIGEYGLGHTKDYFRVEADSTWPVDPDGLHIHNGMWAGLFSGSAGTAMSWWWDLYIHRNNLYHHFTGISRYLAGEDLRPLALRHVKLLGGSDYFRTPKHVGYALAGRDRALGWVYESAYTIANFAPGDEPSDNVRVEIDGLNSGDWWAEFWDTYDGGVVAREKVTVFDGSVELRLPPFCGDIAFKLVQDEPKGEVQTETPQHDRMVQKLKELAKQFKK
jgi:hypothetical protein